MSKSTSAALSLFSQPAPQGNPSQQISQSQQTQSNAVQSVNNQQLSQSKSRPSGTSFSAKISILSNLPSQNVNSNSHHPQGASTRGNQQVLASSKRGLSSNYNDQQQQQSQYFNADGLVSTQLIESMIQQAFDPYKKDLFVYAKKEIFYSDTQSYFSSKQGQQKTTDGKKSEYDALYEPMQDQLIENKSRQISQVYLKEYEDLMSKIGLAVTDQVSELLNKIVDQIHQTTVTNQVKQHSLFGGKSALLMKEDLLRDIQTQMNKFQQKYEESKSLISSMRKNYIKEIQHLRAVEDIQFQNKVLNPQQYLGINNNNNSRTNNGGNISSLGKHSIHVNHYQAHNPVKDYLEVYFFTPTEGLDEDTCKIFNNYFAKLKFAFESKLDNLNQVNQELSWKVALIDESKKIAEMNPQELTELMFTKEKDQDVIWQIIKQKLSQETLEKIAEEEFSEIISQITEKEIITQVEKITQESKFQIQDAKEKLQKEINYLRLQITYRNEEIEKLKESKILEIDKARMESYEKAERRFFENLRLKEAKFQEERDTWKQKLDEAVKDDNEKYNSIFLQMSMMKWRFIVAIIKLKSGDQGSIDNHIQEIIGKIMDGQVNKYIQRVEQLENQLQYERKAQILLKDDLDKLKYQLQQKDDKIDLLLAELSKSQEENYLLSAKNDKMAAEMRGFQTELEQIERAKNVLQELVNNVEKDKNESERKLAQANSHVQQLQIQLGSAYQSDGGAGLGDSPLSHNGQAFKNFQQPSVNMNNLLSSTKFNSKVFAQKTLKNMIDNSKSTMGNVYQTNQINIGIDTGDLVEISNAWTQYKESHFQAKEDAELIARNESGITFPVGKRESVEKEIQTDEGLGGRWIEESEPNQLIQHATAVNAEAAAAATAVTAGDNQQNQSNLEEMSSFVLNNNDQMQNRSNTSDSKKAKSNQEAIKIPLGQPSYNDDNKHTILEEYQDKAGKGALKPSTNKGHQRSKNRRGYSSNQGVMNSSSSFNSNTHLGHQGGARFPQQSSNLKRNQDIEDQLDDISLNNSDIYYKGDDQSQNPKINDEVFKKALEYMRNKEVKRDFKKARAMSQLQHDEELPQVYRRLWDDVAKKSKKAKELQKHFDQQRKLEWIKLLQTKNQLNLSDKKSQDILSKIYEQMSDQTIKSLHGISLNHLLSNHSDFATIKPIDMSQLIDAFSQEQEIQYQEAIRKWEQQNLLKQQQQLLQQQQIQGTVVQGNPMNDQSQMFITEKIVDNQDDRYNQSPPYTQLHLDDKGVQTDFYLLETLIQTSVPNYQQRLNQFLMNKQNSQGGGVASITRSTLNQSKQTNYNSNYTTAAATISASQSISLNNSVAYDPQEQKKKALFMNSRIRQASIINKQRKVMTSTNNSPKNRVQQPKLSQNFILDMSKKGKPLQNSMQANSQNAFSSGHGIGRHTHNPSQSSMQLQTPFGIYEGVEPVQSPSRTDKSPSLHLDSKYLRQGGGVGYHNQTNQNFLRQDGMNPITSQSALDMQKSTFGAYYQQNQQQQFYPQRNQDLFVELKSAAQSIQNEYHYGASGQVREFKAIRDGDSPAYIDGDQESASNRLIHQSSDMQNMRGSFGIEPRLPMVIVNQQQQQQQQQQT